MYFVTGMQTSGHQVFSSYQLHRRHCFCNLRSNHSNNVKRTNYQIMEINATLQRRYIKKKKNEFQNELISEKKNKPVNTKKQKTNSKPYKIVLKYIGSIEPIVTGCLASNRTWFNPTFILKRMYQNSTIAAGFQMSGLDLILPFIIRTFPIYIPFDYVLIDHFHLQHICPVGGLIFFNIRLVIKWEQTVLYNPLTHPFIFYEACLVADLI